MHHRFKAQAHRNETYDWGNRYSLPFSIQDYRAYVAERAAAEREKYRQLFAEARQYPFELPPRSLKAA